MKKLINQIRTINKQRLVFYILLCSTSGIIFMAIGSVSSIIGGGFLIAISTLLGLLVGISDNNYLIEKFDEVKSEIKELREEPQLRNNKNVQDKLNNYDEQLDRLVDDFQSNVSLNKIKMLNQEKTREKEEITLTKLWKSKILSMIKYMDSYLERLNQKQNISVESTINIYPLNLLSSKKPLYAIHETSRFYLNIFFRPINDYEMVIIFATSNNVWDLKIDRLTFSKKVSLFVNEKDNTISKCKIDFISGFYGFQTKIWDGKIYVSLNELGSEFLNDLLEFIYALDSVID